MPFNDRIWHERAKQGDVAGVAINATVAIRNLSLAIMAIREGEDPAEYLKTASECADSLHRFFRELSGYVPEGE